VKGGETSGGVEKFQVAQLSYHHVLWQLVELALEFSRYSSSSRINQV
jgi:hypothetical protein